MQVTNFSMIGHQCIKTICEINKEKMKLITESQHLKTLEWLLPIIVCI